MKITLKESVFLFLIFILLGFSSWFYIHFDQAQSSNQLSSQTAPTQFATQMTWTIYTSKGQISQSLTSPYWAYYAHTQKDSLKQPRITLYPNLSEERHKK
jgi:LPS export ABC transporter protein LptC